VSLEGDILNCYRRKIPVHYHISPLSSVKNIREGLLVVTELVQVEETQKEQNNKSFSSAGIIGYSPKMQQVFDKIPLISQTDASALITGETGTGKDKIAEIIHRHSPRARFPFIKINCGALPLDLLESELFGYKKGAFTGATRNKAGMFKLADRGTLFLTEIGDMPLQLQVKLLSVLDDKQFYPIGGEQSISVNVRIIAATHRSLREQVKKNKFREDLFYRLNVLSVHLPPLRERDVDIRYLLDHFLDKFVAGLGKNIVGFTASAMDALLNYNYPGNVREISNIVEYAVNMCKKKKIGLEHLPSYISEPLPDSPVESGNREMDRFESQPSRAQVEQTDSSGVSSATKPASWSDIERQMIIDTLKEHNGSRKHAAANLEWTRMKLWRKMKKYALLP
jgi:transcriptional regulator with PAS, ATPase and Fis domain